MIQRLQSIFLLLIAVALMTALFFPLWYEKGSSFDGLEMIELNVYQLVHGLIDENGNYTKIINVKSTVYISFFYFLATAIALYSLFQYKKRIRQIYLGAVNSLVIGGSVLFSWMVYVSPAESIVDPASTGNMGIGIYFLITALLFNTIANRLIRRDEKMVKESDRLR